MNTLQKTYVKEHSVVHVYNQFIYQSSVYRIWKEGASLLEEKYYASDKPIKLTKNQQILKRKKYIIYRFFDLKFAPEEYLIKNGYRLEE